MMRYAALRMDHGNIGHGGPFDDLKEALDWGGNPNLGIFLIDETDNIVKDEEGKERPLLVWKDGQWVGLSSAALPRGLLTDEQIAQRLKADYEAVRGKFLAATYVQGYIDEDSVEQCATWLDPFILRVLDTSDNDLGHETDENGVVRWHDPYWDVEVVQFPLHATGRDRALRSTWVHGHSYSNEGNTEPTTSFKVLADDDPRVLAALAARASKRPYIVGRREVHICYVPVNAASPKEAIEAVASGEYDTGDAVESLPLEYLHALDSDTWTVEEDNR